MDIEEEIIAIQTIEIALDDKLHRYLEMLARLKLRIINLEHEIEREEVSN